MSNSTVIRNVEHSVFRATDKKEISMNMRKIAISGIFLVLAITGGLANADDPGAGGWWKHLSADEQEAVREKWDSISPEEQEAVKKRTAIKRQKWENMTPEQQETYKQSREKRKQQWQSMSAEEREAAKAKMREQRGR